jgi:cell division protein FtsQ
MAATKQRGATRRQPVKPIHQQRDPIAWGSWAKVSLVFMVLLIGVSTIAWIHQDDSLPIKHVSVKGELVYTEKPDLITAVTPYVKGSFFNVDVVKVRQAAEALPWVNQVQVRRIWPDKLLLQVAEHRAIAQWGDDGLVDETGDVFYPPKHTMPAGLVMMHGFKGGSKVMTQRLVDIHQQMSRLGLKVTELTMDQRRSWQLGFSNGMKILIGRANSEQRLKRFAKVYQMGLKAYQKNIEGVDMRYTNGLAVIWKNGQQPQFSELNGAV